MTEITPTGRVQPQRPGIAQAVGKSEQNSRHLAARSGSISRHAGRGSRSTAEPGEELFDHFLLACESGDVDSLRQLLPADAAVYSDGGGKVTAARRPVFGTDRIARFMTNVPRRRIRLGHSSERLVTVNGQPGLLVVEPDGRVSDVITIDIADGAIRGVLIVRNPDKLRHLHDHPLSTSGPML